MSIQDWVELFRVLGIAAPLVALLGWLLREATTERRAITNQFVTALTTIVESNRTAMQANTAVVQDLGSTMREHIAHSEREHERIMQSVQQWYGRERQGPLP